MNISNPTGLSALFFGRLANLCRLRRAERRAGRRAPSLEPLEPRMLFSADLVGTLEWDAGAAAQFPGASAEAVVHVANVGDETAKAAKVSVYASADGVLDTGDLLLGTAQVQGKLKAGASADVDVRLDFDESLVPGRYQLIALLDSGDKVHESDETNNTALGPVFDFAWKFGELPGHHGSEKLSFQDADGTQVQLRIVGAGTGELTWDGSAWDLLVTGTDAHSKLFVQTNGRGDGRFTLDDLHVEGPLAALLARTTDLTGTLEMDDALRGQLVLGSATGATILLPLPGATTAYGGDHHRHGHQSGPQGIFILGDLADSQIRIEGGDLGKLVITGSMISSTVSVGQDPVDGIYDNGDDVLRDGRIGAVSIFGDMSDDSRIVAQGLPKYAFIDHHFVKTAFDARFVRELGDHVAPTVSIDQAAGQADPAADAPIEFSVLFSEAVFGFDASDIDFTGSTVGGTLVANVSGSGANYTVSVTGMTSSGLVVASIAAGAAQDAAGNASGASTSVDNTVSFVTDNVAPTVTIDQAPGQADPASTSPIEFAVAFSEDVFGFDGSDIDFTGSTVGGVLVANVSGSGSSYTVSVSGMTTNGILVASVLAGAAADAAGNASTASTSTDNTVTVQIFDEIAPTVTIDQAAGQADPASTSPIEFAVAFSEDVFEFDASDIDFTGSTVGGTLVANVSGSGSSYTVSVSGMTSNGLVVASILAGAAVDAAGNASTASTSTDNTVTVQIFDEIAPTVTIDQAAGQADPASTSPIEFAVAFSEDVFGFDASDIDFTGSTVGGTLVANVSGSGANYTVSVTGMTSSGLVVASIGAGAAADAGGNASLASTSTDNSVTFLVNSAPVGVDDSFMVDEDGTLTVSAPGVLGNDTDVDSSTLTASLVSSTTNG
ncbi:MAG TPA: Ig-like domain-containing protein, partial [Burkholderiales bacterium]|nr:Ig-like domain-containing protein [Burkholderiales bacterium]